jgi:hypothetical protein
MSCPDINRLIDLLGVDQEDAEVEKHLETCPSCQASFRLLRELPAAFRPEIELPDHLVQGVMENLSWAESSPEPYRPPGLQVLGSGLLGSLTAICVIVATDSRSAGNPVDLLLFALAVGLTACVIHLWLEGGPRAPTHADPS